MSFTQEKMSFTQEKVINIRPKQVRACVSPKDRCYGCNKHCQLGYRFGVLADYIYPTINKEIIRSYFDKNNNIQYSGIAFNVRIVELQKIYAKDLAGKIARLCARYKTR